MDVITRSVSTPKNQLDFNHLYEHLVVDKAIRGIRAQGLNPSLVGWFGGEAFPGAVFFSAGIFSPKIAAKLQDLYVQPFTFTADDIRRTLPALESEERSHIEIANIDQILEALNRFPAKAPPNSIRIVKDKSYKSVSIRVRLESRDPTLELVYLRYYVVLAEVISNYLRDQLGAYRNRYVMVYRHQKTKRLEFVMEYTVSPKQAAKVVATATEIIRELDIDQSFSAVSDHFQVFHDEPLWRDTPIDYYKRTDILTTNQAIADALALPHLKSIHASLKVIKTLN